MVIIQTMRGPFRVLDMYYPRLEQVTELAKHIGFNEVIYIRQMRETLPPIGFVASYAPFETSLVDLTRDEALLFAAMNRTCRSQVRKADRLSDRIEVRQNDSVAYRDFLTVYNDFVSLKKHSERLSLRRLDAFTSSCDVFVAYYEGQPKCGNLILRDKQLKRVGVLFNVSTHLRAEEPSIFISSLNRWLHWYQMRHYKSDGMHLYDLCGFGSDTPERARIAYFKRSLGGVKVVEHNYIIARIMGRTAMRIFYGIRRIRSGMHY